MEKFFALLLLIKVSPLIPAGIANTQDTDYLKLLKDIGNLGDHILTAKGFSRHFVITPSYLLRSQQALEETAERHSKDLESLSNQLHNTKNLLAATSKRHRFRYRELKSEISYLEYLSAEQEKGYFLGRLRFYGHLVPNPFDRCRRLLDRSYHSTLNGSFGIFDQYRWQQCVYVQKFHKNLSDLKAKKQEIRHPANSLTIRLAIDAMIDLRTTVYRYHSKNLTDDQIREIIDDDAKNLYLIDRINILLATYQRKHQS